LSIEQPPAKSCVRLNFAPVLVSTTLRTFRASATTSGPTWSPGKTRMFREGGLESDFVTGAAMLIVEERSDEKAGVGSTGRNFQMFAKPRLYKTVCKSEGAYDRVYFFIGGELTGLCL
jgi:hypothetical protein